MTEFLNYGREDWCFGINALDQPFSGSTNETTNETFLGCFRVIAAAAPLM
jgi:hypothetical protein